MYFVTRPEWEMKNPVFAVFDDPENPCFRWNIVEMRLQMYFYHVHFKPNLIEDDMSATTLLCGTIECALDILLTYPRSSLLLQVPEWLNNDEPGLYRVEAIYNSSDPKAHTYIAECHGGKLLSLHLDSDLQKIMLHEVEKVTIWRASETDPLHTK